MAHIPTKWQQNYQKTNSQEKEKPDYKDKKVISADDLSVKWRKNQGWREIVQGKIEIFLKKNLFIE